MGTMLGFIALVAISPHLAPYLTRREIFFGVTVSRSFREGPLARMVSRRYAVEVWLLAATAAAIVVTSPIPFVSGGMLLGLTVGASVLSRGRGALFVLTRRCPRRSVKRRLGREKVFPGESSVSSVRF
jgi:hypothetical protein